jgi:hypothetical protein
MNTDEIFTVDQGAAYAKIALKTSREWLMRCRPPRAAGRAPLARAEERPAALPAGAGLESCQGRLSHDRWSEPHDHRARDHRGAGSRDAAGVRRAVVVRPSRVPPDRPGLGGAASAVASGVG